MGSYGYHQQQFPLPKCANCGKNKPLLGIFNNHKWSHWHRVCSDACGIRLQKKIDNGMGEPIKNEPFQFYPLGIFGNNDTSKNGRIEALRERIKHLEAQLRIAGVKRKGTPL